MHRRFLAALVLLCLSTAAFAETRISFWNRTVWKAAQAYPLDTNLYTGWGPDWQEAGAFHQMSLAFESGALGFALDTQFNAGAEFKPHINAVQASAVLVPNLLKTSFGKLKIDEYRLSTPFMDKGMGRIQVPDEWLAAAVTVGTGGFRSTLVLPSYAGSTASKNINATSSGPNTPGQQKLDDSWAYFDLVASFDVPRTGLRLVAGSFGDTTGGLAYGSTGTDLPSGFGTLDPEKIVRTYYGGASFRAAGLAFQAAATYWGSSAAAATDETNLRGIAGVSGSWKDVQWGLEALVDYRSEVEQATAKATQVVSGLKSQSYTIEKGPLTGMAFATLSGSLKALTSLDLVAGLAVGAGTQDLYQGNGIGSYSLPLYDRFVEVYPSLTFPAANLKVGFDYKYDLSAGLATWVVPVTLTLSS